MSEMTDEPVPQMNWKWMLAMGVLLIVGGLVALTNAYLASVLVVAMAAAFFLIAGAIQLWLAIRSEHGSAGARTVAAILGVLLILFALSLFAQPFAGLVSLTILLAGFFIATGIVRIWFSLRLRDQAAWGWLLASGVISVALGLFILLVLDEAVPSILGIFLGVELLVSGAASVALALRARQ